MIAARLAPRYGTERLRATRAWYLPGDDLDAWLGEIARWSVSHLAVKLYALPSARDDPRPRGVLAVVPDAARVEPGARCIPYGRVADRLYVPIEARFDPAVDEAELGRLLPPESVCVWHPAVGLVGFAPGEALTPADLIAPGPLRGRAWNDARTGVAFSRRLIAISPERPAPIEVILQQGRDDIGTTAGLDELPRSPDEPRTDPFSTAARYGSRALAGFVQWLAGHVPSGPGRGSWLGRAADWAERSLGAFQAALSAAQNRAVARLLHLLETDPDRGLKYALPLWDAGHRGKAPPSAGLPERIVDFSLGRLGGGGPADSWSASPDDYFRLMTRYRELANRELRLGRHRRAAYIFAHLLGDFSSAASALAQGRHWREAAALYRERLHRPGEAARCLEQGGLWTEAIALYEEVGDFEKAGDLLVKLEQPEAAREAFGKAVAGHRDRRDHLAAARLLEEKLREPDEALAELERGWPASSQAGQCLRGAFRLLGRLGRHEAARDRIAHLAAAPPFGGIEFELADVLSETAQNYPDRYVRHAAADSTRGIASRRLPGAGASNSARLLGAVRRLAPGDRLLGRDCDRYYQRRGAPSPPAKPMPRRRGRRLVRVDTIQMPVQANWKRMVPSGQTIYAAGLLDGYLVLARCNWGGAVDQALMSWRVEIRKHLDHLILAADPLHDDRRVLVHLSWSRRPLFDRVFCTSDRFPSEVRAGGPPISDPILGAAVSPNGYMWLVVGTGEQWTLMNCGPDGEVVATYALPCPWDPDLTRPYIGYAPIHARGHSVYVGICDTVVSYGRPNEPEIVPFSRPVLSLTGSAPNTRKRLAATFNRGGAIWWDDGEVDRTEQFAADMEQPVAGFNRGGYLIAAGRGRLELYATQTRRLELVLETESSPSAPVAVLPERRSDRFGIGTEQGEVVVYEIE